MRSAAAKEKPAVPSSSQRAWLTAGDGPGARVAEIYVAPEMEPVAMAPAARIGLSWRRKSKAWNCWA